MKSLYNYIEESILSGRDKIKGHIGEDILELSKKWLESKKIIFDIDDDNNIYIKESFTLTEPIPAYVHIKKAHAIYFNNTESLTGSMPEKIDKLYIRHAVIDDLKQIENIDVSSLEISSCNCDIHSLKGIPKNCNYISLGNNFQHFNKKDIKKLVNTKPNYIYTLGHYSQYSHTLELGEYDIRYIKQECEKLEKILIKEIPELKSVKLSARERGCFVWLRLDFLTEKDVPYGISDNSIYLDFKYALSDSSLEKSQEGHINLTPEDKQGKYKYYALKGFSAPYIDNGGKKFRKTKIEDFNAKEIADKILDWTKAVVKAAKEDQGGELKK